MVLVNGNLLMESKVETKPLNKPLIVRLWTPIKLEHMLLKMISL